MKRKNDKLELILLGVGILLLLLLFVVKRRLDAPEETATAESRTETMEGKKQEETIQNMEQENAAFLNRFSDRQCMLTIGCHLSSSKGYLAMGKEAVSIGANTFQFFTRNPRGSKAKAIDEADVAAFLSYSKEHGIERILAHAPYTLNPCSKASGQPENLTFSAAEKRCSASGVRRRKICIVHPSAGRIHRCRKRRGNRLGIGGRYDSCGGKRGNDY